jgi:dihydrodipicolinate synthase/N-acetylneuraminate lyase
MALKCNAELITANKIQRLAKGGSANAAIYAGMKSALTMMGILDHDTLTRPMRSMTQDEKGQIPPILKELGLLN